MISFPEHRSPRSRESYPARVWEGLLAAILVCLLPTAALTEPRVLVLQGSQLPPYLAVEKSFSDALGMPVKSINLASAESKQTLRTSATDGALTLAIGPD